MCCKCNIKNKKQCKECTDICTRCDKILPKDNWPNDTIINGKCDKCHKLCIKCEKHVLDGNEVYYKDNRYCEKCIESFNDNKSAQKKFHLITQIKDSKRQFIKWKVAEVSYICITCCRKGWKTPASDINLCRTCKKTQTNKKTFVDKNPDPTDNLKKYVMRMIMIGKDKVFKWEEMEVKVICQKCFSGKWIPSKLQPTTTNNHHPTTTTNNHHPTTTNKQHQRNIVKYYCENCKPINPLEKYKFDKNSKKWTIYCKKITCQICDKDKWINITSIEKINKHKHKCKKCISDEIASNAIIKRLRCQNDI